jgi:hypothetical protein
MPHRARDTISVVIAGLDPAIHLSFEKCFLRRWLDTRVKPAYDAEYVTTSFSNSDSNFKQPSARVLAPPRELGF